MSKIDNVTTNEQHVRLKIFEGELPVADGVMELLRIEKAQHDATQRRLNDALASLRQMGCDLDRLRAR